jgi:hypothetical protein
MSGIGDSLAWLGGADLETLRKSPRDRGRFVQMGCVLLTTSGIAGLSMTFAIHNTMHLPVAIAMIYGILWGLVILNLDRFLVISMGSTRDMKRLIGIVIPRLLMAVVVSLVVSTPITLEIFHNDIYATMTTMNLTQSKQVANDEASSALQGEVNTLQDKITGDQQILDGKLPDNITSAQLQTAQSQASQLATQVSTAKQAEINAYATWQCELYGYSSSCNGGSGKTGDGPIAQAKQAVYEQDVQTYNTLEGEYQTADSHLADAQKSMGQAQETATVRYQKQALQALPALRSQLKKAQAQLASQNANAQYNTANNTGLLRQLEALFQASSGNPALLLAHLTVAALFFLIELLPVVVKLLLNLNQPTTYEQILKAEDDKLLDAVKADRRAERRKKERESNEGQQIADAASAARVKQALDMTQRQEGLGIQANETVAAKMEEILDAALKEWSAQVQATLKSGQPAPGQPLAPGIPLPRQTPAHGQQPPNVYTATGNGNPVPGHPGYGQQPGYPQQLGYGQQPVNGQMVNGNHAAYPPAPTYGPPAANGQLSGSKDFGLPDAGDEL